MIPPGSATSASSRSDEQSPRAIARPASTQAIGGSTKGIAARCQSRHNRLHKTSGRRTSDCLIVEPGCSLESRPPPRPKDRRNPSAAGQVRTMARAATFHIGSPCRWETRHPRRRETSGRCKSDCLFVNFRQSLPRMAVRNGETRAEASSFQVSSSGCLSGIHAVKWMPAHAPLQHKALGISANAINLLAARLLPSQQHCGMGELLLECGCRRLHQPACLFGENRKLKDNLGFVIAPQGRIGVSHGFHCSRGDPATP